MTHEVSQHFCRKEAHSCSLASHRPLNLDQIPPKARWLAHSLLEPGAQLAVSGIYLLTVTSEAGSFLFLPCLFPLGRGTSVILDEWLSGLASMSRRKVCPGFDLQLWGQAADQIYRWVWCGVSRSQVTLRLQRLL